MSDNELVRVPFGDAGSDKATLLLAAAESKGLDPSVVRVDTQGSGHAFIVPKEVADAALSGEHAEGVEEHVDPWGNQPVAESRTDYPQAEATKQVDTGQKSQPQPTKKAPAKKAPAKRAPAKKAAAKKTASK